MCLNIQNYYKNIISFMIARGIKELVNFYFNSDTEIRLDSHSKHGLGSSHLFLDHREKDKTAPLKLKV